MCSRMWVAQCESLLGKRGTLNVSLGANRTGRRSAVIKRNALDGRAEAFYAYVPHQAV